MSAKPDLFNSIAKGVRLMLAVNRELRASRSEKRLERGADLAEKRELRAEEIHQKKYFGRIIK